MTAIELGKILFEEFEREDWGDIDPYCFQNPPKKDDINDDMAGLYEVLERVAKRIDERIS